MSTHIAVEWEGEKEVEQGDSRGGEEGEGRAKGTTVNHAAAAWQTHPKTAAATSASVRTCYI